MLSEELEIEKDKWESRLCLQQTTTLKTLVEECRINLCLGSLIVEHRSYKAKTAEHYRNEVPMVDSTGVRLGFINLGDRSDGLRRKGS